MSSRRLLLRFATMVSVLASGGAPVFGLGSLAGSDRVDSRYCFRGGRVPADLRALYSPCFHGAFLDLTLDDLLAALDVRGVHRRGRIDVARVRQNAADDPLVEFDGFLWTESELMLYAVIARLREEEEGHRGVAEGRDRKDRAVERGAVS